MPVQDDYRRKLVSAADAAASVPSGVQVLVAMGLGAPPAVLAALADRVRADELLDLDLYYGMGGDAIGDTILQPGVIEKLRAHTFFVAGRDHHIIADPARADRETLDFIPVNFSNLPRVIREHLDVDTFLVQVSPMDTVRGSVCSSPVRSTWVKIRAAMIEACSTDVSGRTTMNSSPP